jgi:hypothetical protein
LWLGSVGGLQQGLSRQQQGGDECVGVLHGFSYLIRESYSCTELRAAARDGILEDRGLAQECILTVDWLLNIDVLHKIVGTVGWCLCIAGIWGQPCGHA